MTRRRGFRPLPALALLFAAMATIASGCGIDHELVGGSCAEGYTQCGAHCVSLLDDDQNCGACGVVCNPGPCVEGACRNEGDGALVDGSDGATDGATDEGTLPDGTNGDAADGASDGTASDGPLADGTADDGTLPDGALADGPSGDGRVPTDDGAVDDSATPTDDGATDDGATGDAATADANPTDDGATSDGAPPFSCDAGLTSCGGPCVDLTSDPENCGGCRNVCASQLCVASSCAGTVPGNVVFIGHDYQSTLNGTAQARVLTNAIFLAQPVNVHVLSYEKYADQGAVARVHGILSSSAAAGRTLTVTPTSDDADVTGLTFLDFQVLLVLDQPIAPVDLGALGTSWAPTLASFTQAGGIVIVLDSGGGAHGMPALVTGTGLLSVTGDAPLTIGTPLQVVAPGDALGVGVLSPYAAGQHSVSVTTEPPAGNLVYVVVAPNDGGTAPVVVHKVL
jgi:hypothetical protein